MQSPTNYDQNIEGNPIGSLQEMCMAWGWPLPTYNLVEEIGVPHSREFTIECEMLQRREIGKGKTKKLAKQIAAHKMWIGIQQRPINKIEISKILNIEQNQNGKMAKMPTKALIPPNNFTSRENRRNFFGAENAQEPKNYAPKGFSTKSETKAGSFADSSKLNGDTFSKFGNSSNNSIKGRLIEATSVQKKSETNPLDNNFIKSFKNLRATNRIQEYPRDATLNNLNEEENTKQIGGATRKTSTSKSENLPNHNGEELKRISLQEVYLYSERNVPFKAMGAEFLKKKMVPSKDLIAKPISREQSLLEIPMENKSNNYKKVITSNPIGILQEMCCARGWKTPEYSTVSEFGEQFVVECKVLEHRETGKGKNKKHAKKLAAHRMWSKLEEHSRDTK